MLSNKMPSFKDRIENAAKIYVNDNINSPTEADHLYTMNVMLQGVIEFLKWQQESHQQLVLNKAEQQEQSHATD